MNQGFRGFPSSLEPPSPVQGPPTLSWDLFLSLRTPSLGSCVSCNDFRGLLMTILLSLLMTTLLVSTQLLATWSATQQAKLALKNIFCDIQLEQLSHPCELQRKTVGIFETLYQFGNWPKKNFSLRFQEDRYEKLQYILGIWMKNPFHTNFQTSIEQAFKNTNTLSVAICQVMYDTCSN